MHVRFSRRRLAALISGACLGLAAVSCSADTASQPDVAPQRDIGSQPDSASEADIGSRPEITSEPARPVAFAPFVDVTLVPTLAFDDPTAQPADDVMLGFVVADPAAPCTPSWGTFHDLDSARETLDLEARISRLRERGGSAIVSFGGAANAELATVCLDADRLEEAYGSVIDAYDSRVVDFDIEGAALADPDANRRRSEVIARLQDDRPDLEVWFTVPITPNGIPDSVVALLDAVLSAGVDLTGVNAMTMNYGTMPEGASMSEASVSALQGLHRQLAGVYGRAGRDLSDTELWNRIAATPMIGQNDVPGERFTVADARSLASFAQQVQMRRISMWSANRDTPCDGPTDEGSFSNTCSGVDQQPGEFSEIFGGN